MCRDKDLKPPFTDITINFVRKVPLQRKRPTAAVLDSVLISNS